MLALSDAARAALLDGTARPVGRVDVYAGDTVLRNVPLDALRPSAVNVDATAATTRSATLNFSPDVGDELLPLLPLVDGPLVPLGNEACCYIDLGLPDGTTWTVPAGVLRLRRPRASTGKGGTVSVAARDRSQAVIDAKLTAPYDVLAGTNYATAIRELIEAGVPWVTFVGFDESVTAFTTPPLHFALGDDRWRRAMEMAEDVGKRVTFNASGECVLADVPDPATAPSVQTYGDGVVIDVDQELDADDTFSHAIVVAQPADLRTGPMISHAYDDDPTSPTYWRGLFGDRAVRSESNYVGSQEQNDAAAEALLRSKKGLLEDVKFSAVSLYAHEDTDVVKLRNGELGIDSHYVLQRFPVPLGPGPATYTTRARRVT